MKKFKVFLTVALTLIITVSAALAVTMSVDELKELTMSENSNETYEPFGAFASPIRDGIEYDGFGGVVEYWITGDCQDATTTIISQRNNYPAMLVDKVIIDITGLATSTWTMDVGTSSTAYAAPNEIFVDDTGLATSTLGMFMSGVTTVSAAQGGFTDPGTNSQDIALVKNGEYINATVTSAYTGAFTEATNTFACTYKIHGIEK